VCKYLTNLTRTRGQNALAHVATLTLTLTLIITLTLTLTLALAHVATLAYPRRLTDPEIS
jgi:hypothetical protein